MASPQLSDHAETYLRKLCQEISSRRVGSDGNRAATDFFTDTVKRFGFDTEAPVFDCMDWREDGVLLSAGDDTFQAFASPYALGCNVSGPLRVASTVDELVALNVSNEILLLRGEIAGQQLMPRNFPFYNPDEHKRIYQLLETKKPAAIIAATTRDPQMVGSMYPFPLIEDGDFDIPSVYMTDVEGERLAEYAGKEVLLHSRARRIPATGCNVIARKGADANRRVVLFAHIDAKMGTPGALDNASGVVVLLLLSELLANNSGALGVELVALNGEDYYSNPGEQQYLARNAGQFDDIVLGINVDGVAYHKGRVAYSLYDCPTDIADSVRKAFFAYSGLVEGEPWYQGDHMLFLINQRPALAITSEQVAEAMQIIHTPEDTSEIINPNRLASTALALRDLLLHLELMVEAGGRHSAKMTSSQF